MTPKTVGPGSHKSVWWKCNEGHEWQTAVYTRWAGHGCPYCKGKRLLKGKKDLASKYPELARQWHPDKNGSLKPEDVFPGSDRIVWWQCASGHEWQAAISSRVSGLGCPVCSSKKLLPGCNDLATTNPELISQWHPAKNGALTPDQVFPFSMKRVWWICGQGHEWQASISSRTKSGSGCPICAGKKVLPGYNDLKTAQPRLAAQWHPTKNNGLTPDKVRPQSNRKVW